MSEDGDFDADNSDMDLDYSCESCDTEIYYVCDTDSATVAIPRSVLIGM